MDNQKLDKVLQKYKLTTKEKIYAARKIFSYLVSGKEKSCYPTAIIVAGQPGAGKTNLALFSASLLPNAVVVDIDEFRPFHPHYQQIINEDSEYFAPTTNKFISEMSAIVTNWLIAEEFDMILHKTFKADAVIFDTIEPLKTAGYNVILQSLAVHGLESKLSAMERSKFEYNAFGHCRYINFDYHDQAYKNLGIIAKILEDNELIDCSQVYVRGTSSVEPQLVYSHNISSFPNSLNTQDVNTEVFPNTKTALDFSRKVTAQGLPNFTHRIQKLKDSAVSPYELSLLEQLENEYYATPFTEISIQPSDLAGAEQSNNVKMYG